MTYKPKPINTDGIDLDHALVALREKLSEQAHDLWAAKRLEDGWRYGPSRDDAAKTHPCLVPYDQLPESEKSYDRALVESTLKSIIALGFEIRRREASQP